MSTPLIDGIIVDAYADGETNWGATMNQNLVRTGWMLFRAVKSVGSNAPVAGADNDRHIVGIAPTGAWAGHPAEMARQNIATFGGWDFLVLPNDSDVLNFALAGPGAAGTFRKIAGVWTLVTPPAGPPSGAAGGDLTGTYPNPTVAALAITDAKVAAANKDGLAAVPSLRTLGAGAQQAMPGNTVIPPSSFRQSLLATLGADAATASAVFVNLLTLPITVGAGGGNLICRLTAAFSGLAASTGTGIQGQFRIRIDGAVGDATAAGRGAIIQAPTVIGGGATPGGFGAAVSLSVRLPGVAAGAHNIFVDWLMARTLAGTSTVQIRQVTQPALEHANLIVEEVTV